MSKQDTRAKTARRKHGEAFKRTLIERCLHPGASVSAIALENGINANLLFKWRRMHLRESACASAPGARQLASRSAHALLLPVRIEPAAVGAMAPATASMPRPSSGVIEIDIGAARVRVRGAVDPANLHCVLQTLGALR